MSIDKLPPIDYAVIAHNHYDHLDLDSVTAIGNQCLWLLPKDNEKYLHRIGITNTVELDWWASHGIGDLSFTGNARATLVCSGSYRSLSGIMVRLGDQK